MKKIEEHIYDLLFTHDCVTLPDFGGFVGLYSSAKLDYKTNTFLPPSKKISFNKHLSTDDGLLSHEVANKRKLTYAEANLLVKEYIQDLKQELELNKRVEISKLGTFFLDSKRTLKFISLENNFSIKHFGLPALQPKKIEKPVKIVEKPIIKLIPTQAERETTPIIPIESKNKKEKMNLWWVAAILIPIAFYSAWIPMKTGLLDNTKQFHYSDLNPFTFQKIKKYKTQSLETLSLDKVEKILVYDYSKSIQKVNLDKSIYVWVRNTEVPIAKIETTFVDQKQIEQSSELNLNKVYHIIGGCFSKEENAIHLVNQMTKLGYSAKILDKNKGLFRVSIGQYSNRKLAKKIKTRIKSEQEISSWILKR